MYDSEPDRIRTATFYRDTYSGALGGFQQTAVLAEPPEALRAEWGSERDPTTEAGLDIKYSPTSNLALDLTVNACR